MQYKDLAVRCGFRKEPTVHPTLPGTSTRLINTALIGALYMASNDSPYFAPEWADLYDQFLRIGLAADPEVVAICGRLA